MNSRRTSFLPPIAQDLQRVRAMLRDLVAEVDESIRWLVEYSAPDRGKLLRPTLLLLSAGAFGTIGPQHLRVAAALELVHNATLLHDDVLDHGRVRRGLTTVNCRWGNQAAVYLGDTLLARVFEMNASFPPRVRAVLGRMICRTCEGEIHQTVSSGRFTLGEPQYLTMVGRKTAALFRGACSLGTLVAGTPEPACRAAARFGYALGMAYQIMDDLLDLVGDGRTLRKTLGTDLRNAKLTLPLIHALRVLPEPRRSTLLLALQGRRLARSELLDVLTTSGSIDYVLARIGRYADRATGALAEARQTPMKAALLEMPRRIVREAVEQSAPGRERSPASCRMAAQG